MVEDFRKNRRAFYVLLGTLALLLATVAILNALGYEKVDSKETVEITQSSMVE